MLTINKDKLLLFGFLVCISALLGLNSESPDEFNRSAIDIGVVVSDLEQSMKFYTEVVGMTHTGSFTVGEETLSKMGLTQASSLEVQVLKLKDEPHASTFKLLTFDDLERKPRQTFIEDDIGLQYVTIVVNSLDSFLKRLKEHNIQLAGDGPITVLDGTANMVAFQDPDGTFIELIASK